MTDEINYQIIYVTGPYGSGKSTFISTIGEVVDPAEVDFFLSTDACRLTVGEDTYVYLFAKPGNGHDGDLWKGMRQNALGIVIVVDSSHPETFIQARYTIETFCEIEPHIPLMVVANFQDHPEARSPDDLRSVLHVPGNVLVVPCVATDHESVKNVLIQLLHIVSENIEDADRLRQAGQHD